MSEKHHPASSKRARTRMTRAMRREGRIDVSKKTRLKHKRHEQPGFARGARIRTIDPNPREGTP